MPSLIKREYLSLYHVIRAAFMIFHGPRVESSFSLMQTVLSFSKPCTQISTFSAIQTVKYHLLNNNKRSIELFEWKDMSASIDKMMCADIPRFPQPLPAFSV